MEKKLTKIKIERLATEIINYLRKRGLDDDVSIYFNNKRMRIGNNWDREKKEFIPYTKVEENMNPLKYFSYANPKHILSMSFEGSLYHLLNGYSGGSTKGFDNIFKKYGLYYELGNAWNLSCYPYGIEYEDIEYTSYEVKPEPKYIYSDSRDIPLVLIIIKEMWDSLSETTTHLGGSITIGDGFEFSYNGKYYKMTPPHYQGSMIYEHWIDIIKKELKNIGATEIHYNYGRMD